MKCDVCVLYLLLGLQWEIKRKTLLKTNVALATRSNLFAAKKPNSLTISTNRQITQWKRTIFYPSVLFDYKSTTEFKMFVASVSNFTTRRTHTLAHGRGDGAGTNQYTVALASEWVADTYNYTCIERISEHTSTSIENRWADDHVCMRWERMFGTKHNNKNMANAIHHTMRSVAGFCVLLTCRKNYSTLCTGSSGVAVRRSAHRAGYLPWNIFTFNGGSSFSETD